MKKVLTLLFASMLMAVASFAQCDKNVLYTTDKHDILSPDGQVEESKTDAVTIEVFKEKIVLTVADKAEALNATIKETDCQWKTFNKEGKAVYKVEFQKPNSGETSDGTITIEGKDGKLTIVVEIAKMDGRKIRLAVSKHEEK